MSSAAPSLVTHRPRAAPGAGTASKRFSGFVALAVTAVVAFGMGVGVPWWLNRPVDTTDLLIGLLALVTLLPTSLALLREKGDLLEPLPVIGGLFFLYYAVRAVSLANGTPDLEEMAPNIADDFNHWIDPAVRLSLACFAGALAGYLLPAGGLAARILPRPRWLARDTREVRIIVLWGIGVAFRGLAIARGAYLTFSHSADVDLSTQSYIDIFSQLDWVAIFLLGARYYQGRLSPGMRLFLWLVVVPESVIAGLITGSKIGAFLPFAFLVAARHYFKKRLGAKELALLVGVIAFVFVPIGTAMRAGYVKENTGTGRFTADQTTDLAGQAVTHVRKQASANTSNFLLDSLAQISDRLCGLDSSMVALKMTPAVLPWTSKSPYYLMPLSATVPRIVWKSKPIVRAVPNWERDYWGLPEDNPSMISTTHTASFYLAFGWTGAIVGMFALGLFWRLLYDWHRLQGSALALCSYFLFLHNITDIEGDPVLVYAGLAHTALLVVATVLLVGDRSRAASG